MAHQQDAVPDPTYIFVMRIAGKVAIGLGKQYP